MKEKLALVKLF